VLTKQGKKEVILFIFLHKTERPTMKGQPQPQPQPQLELGGREKDRERGGQAGRQAHRQADFRLG